MPNLTTLTITDDSGFLAIVNADKYNSFVNEQWSLPQLFERFVDEMNNDNLIIWSTGFENTWTINFVNKPSDRISFREFSKTITVTGGQVFLTNYEDLTTAAQYENENIPAKHNSNLYIRLDNGAYEFKIRQLFNPEDYGQVTEGEVSFEIVIQPNTKEAVQQIDKVFWWHNDNQMIEPPDLLDGARVIKWAWSGQEPFGYVGDENDPEREVIYGLAICQYDDSDGVYRFSCDNNWESVQDGLYDTVENAIEQLPDQYKNVKANWQTK